MSPKRINQHLYDMAKNNVSSDDMQRYEEIGKKMYESVDYDTIQILNNPEMLLESTSYIVEGLKSGLHYSYLSDREKAILKESYGEDWILKLNLEEAKTD